MLLIIQHTYWLTFFDVAKEPGGQRDVSPCTYLVASRKEVVVEELLPVEALQAEVEALPVGAVEFPLQRQRAVVGPVES